MGNIVCNSICVVMAVACVGAIPFVWRRDLVNDRLGLSLAITATLGCLGFAAKFVEMLLRHV